MANVTPDWHEPDIITCGDSINFQRNFGKYPAPAWVVEYVIIGAGIPISFLSVQAAPASTEQLVFVAGNVTEGWPPGVWEMSGYASNAATGERYEVYHPAPIKI